MEWAGWQALRQSPARPLSCDECRLAYEGAAAGPPCGDCEGGANPVELLPANRDIAWMWGVLDDHRPHQFTPNGFLFPQPMSLTDLDSLATPRGLSVRERDLLVLVDRIVYPAIREAAIERLKAWKERP